MEVDGGQLKWAIYKSKRSVETIKIRAQMIAIVEPAYSGPEAEIDDGDSHVRVEDSRLAIRGSCNSRIFPSRNS